MMERSIRIILISGRGPCKISFTKGSSWKVEKGPDGANMDGLLGVTLFNHTWQFSLGATLPVQSDWGYKLDTGVVFGLNYRQY